MHDFSRIVGNQDCVTPVVLLLFCLSTYPNALNYTINTTDNNDDNTL